MSKVNIYATGFQSLGIPIYMMLCDYCVQCVMPLMFLRSDEGLCSHIDFLLNTMCNWAAVDIQWSRKSTQSSRINHGNNDAAKGDTFFFKEFFDIWRRHSWNAAMKDESSMKIQESCLIQMWMISMLQCFLQLAIIMTASSSMNMAQEQHIGMVMRILWANGSSWRARCIRTP